MNHKVQKYEQSGNVRLPLRLLVWVGKLAVLGLTLYYLREAVLDASTHSAFSSQTLLKVWAQEKVAVIMALLLLPLNWGVEAFKWQYLSGKIEKLSFWSAYKAVLVGLSLGFITPNRVGDYAGRILTLHKKNRADAIGAILLGRLCQLYATLLVGSGALAFFFYSYYMPLATPVGFSVAVGLLMLNGWALALLFSFQWAVALLEKVPYLRRWVHYFAVVGQFSAAELMYVLMLSGLRYAVFMFQFILLLWAFGVNLSLDLYVWGVAGTFLLKSVVPSINALADIGMRELSAMFFFGLMGQDTLLVLGASLSLWAINIALPSVLGLVFVLPLKLSNTR
ncbi:lysylphosphatidylglycerol synthase domain-containing protein [Rufibacter roseus]|uniref:Lysylphosphatidylglycerol synthase domain-containing protein n=1 Tax=Rufibacter roseus TaxID=1567108 RepID=A0ABW2DNQ9_9BACT|nr:lysylphosphatidylglycerol synthase domain-containing protein [Rufibacter roseus]